MREAWIVDYTDQQGDQHIKHFDRKKDADDYQAAVKVDIKKGLRLSPSKSPTISEAAENWHKRVEADGMNGDGPAERSTLRQYRQHIDLHIVPRIGKVKLGELTQTAIENFRDDLLKSLSRPLARKVFTSFKSILKASKLIPGFFCCVVWLGLESLLPLQLALLRDEKVEWIRSEQTGHVAHALGALVTLPYPRALAR